MECSCRWDDEEYYFGGWLYVPLCWGGCLLSAWWVDRSCYSKVFRLIFGSDRTDPMNFIIEESILYLFFGSGVSIICIEIYHWTTNLIIEYQWELINGWFVFKSLFYHHLKKISFITIMNESDNKLPVADDTSSNTCSMVGLLGILIQIGLGLLSFSVLLVKRCR